MTDVTLEMIFGNGPKDDVPKRPVTIGYGKENFDNCGITITCMNVTEPFVRQYPSQVFQRHGSMHRHPASDYPDVHGYLYTDTLLVPDGAVILIQSQRKFNRSPICDAGVFVRVRNTGPLMDIRATLPMHRLAKNTVPFLVFAGRGDVLDLQTLATHDIEPPTSWIRGFLDPDQIREAFIVQEAAPQSEDKPTYEKAERSDGVEVLIRRRPARKVRSR